MSAPSVLRRGVHTLAAEPRTFDALRWILTAGYRGVKDVLHEEGITEAASILDIGCGTGAMAGLFRPEGYVGVDTNPDYISRARSKNSRYRFEVVDGRALPFADGSFDAVVILAVIHHLDDIDARSLLQESRRVLAPGGVLWSASPFRHGVDGTGSGTWSAASMKGISSVPKADTPKWSARSSTSGLSATFRGRVGCATAWRLWSTTPLDGAGLTGPKFREDPEREGAKHLTVGVFLSNSPSYGKVFKQHSCRYLWVYNCHGGR